MKLDTRFKQLMNKKAPKIPRYPAGMSAEQKKELDFAPSFEVVRTYRVTLVRPTQSRRKKPTTHETIADAHATVTAAKLKRGEHALIQTLVNGRISHVQNVHGADNA